MIEITVQQVSDMLGGIIEGDSETKLSNIAKIEEAKISDLCFLANSKYEKYIYTTTAGAVLVSKDFQPQKEISSTLIRVEDPYSAFTQILEFYAQYLIQSKVGVEEPSFVGENSIVGEHIYRGAFSYIGKNSNIGNNVKIYPNVTIGENVTIGDNSVLFHGVKVYDNCVVGNNCKIQASTVIGSDGFGFAPQKDGTYKTIPQLGNVVLEDNVDIGANTTIDCATMGSTIIKKGAKIDNLVQIAHNAIIGENTVIAAQSGVSGSTEIGKNCVIAGQVGIVGHLKIADKTTIGAQSGVSKSIKKGGTIIQGSPAFGYKDNLKSQVVFRKLPELESQIRELREKVLNLR